MRIFKHLLFEFCFYNAAIAQLGLTTGANYILSKPNLSGITGKNNFGLSINVSYRLFKNRITVGLGFERKYFETDGIIDTIAFIELNTGGILLVPYSLTSDLIMNRFQAFVQYSILKNKISPLVGVAYVINFSEQQVVLSDLDIRNFGGPLIPGSNTSYSIMTHDVNFRIGAIYNPNTKLGFSITYNLNCQLSISAPTQQEWQNTYRSFSSNFSELSTSIYFFFGR